MACCLSFDVADNKFAMSNKGQLLLNNDKPFSNPIGITFLSCSLNFLSK